MYLLYSRSSTRDHSGSRRNSQTRNNSVTSVEGSREEFKIPQSHHHSQRRPSEDRYDSNYENFHSNSRNPSRDCSWERQRSKPSTSENWREEIVRSRQNSERDGKNMLDEIKNIDITTKKAGVIVLNQPKPDPVRSPPSNMHDLPK